MSVPELTLTDLQPPKRRTLSVPDWLQWVLAFAAPFLALQAATFIGVAVIGLVQAAPGIPYSDHLPLAIYAVVLFFGPAVGIVIAAAVAPSRKATVASVWAGIFVFLLVYSWLRGALDVSAGYVVLAWPAGIIVYRAASAAALLTAGISSRDFVVGLEIGAIGGALVGGAAAIVATLLIRVLGGPSSARDIARYGRVLTITILGAALGTYLVVWVWLRWF